MLVRIDWNAFRYKNTIPQSVSLFQTIIQLPHSKMNEKKYPTVTPNSHRITMVTNMIKENILHSIRKPLPPQAVITTNTTPKE
jgi:hypothetical protein